MTRPFGAIARDKGVTFHVWAPEQPDLSVAFVDGGEMPMQRDAAGFFTLDAPGATPGQRYWLRLKEGLRPDPASRFQPEGPLGPSQIVDLRFEWSDHGWRGAPPPHRHVVYEMHLGTFTREGTWAGAMTRLPYLAGLGITTVEVMPIAEFGGDFGWGYDGVNLFAPAHIYGDPQSMQQFVNEAHRLGLAVILDVVYNHFGPVGNFLSEFSRSVRGAPGDWGDSINYDGEGSATVREFVVENAAYWIREFHLDGLRLDATHGIKDASPEHIVSEICREARAAAAGRPIFIVAESEPQDTSLLKEGGAYADGVDAIWNEDWHHSAFVALTGRRPAYFTDYRGTAPEFAAMARHGSLYQGQYYGWQQQPRGGFSLGLPSSRFVCFLENHDQVANTGLGDRLYQQSDQQLWRAATALLLLGPAIPMLFQGQEFGSSRPFTYFADHDGELADAVAKGRLEFLAQFPALATPEMQELIPTPAARATFTSCILDDTERSADSAVARLHRDLLTLRRSDDVLQHAGTSAVTVESSAPTPSIVLIRYVSPHGHRLLIVNLADDCLSLMNDPLLAPVPGTIWATVWSSDHPRYGGHGALPFSTGRWLIAGRSATFLASREDDDREGHEGREPHA